ncbi:glycerol-3-phosphate 1-O-acyltransferase PlsY [Legionella hackeliae]|uniref:Glycerol-3-phosphate acyltransferase n=1 Tax=Legionella hackeliae TaxID=449 RepID=A0A0A8ULQ9_LEGHA|nr:glycerol-3-phosphate 1-O-acyltransferase PlsY [Legionella hackeliae]KTD10149.1 transmembrane protein [Legionella hackeliae]CEK09643.1 Glycerol-3-phosphate acyltransferase [Legionella hackeliae]STX49554.1 transmembrane protein [Legionella hackeliae]
MLSALLFLFVVVVGYLAGSVCSAVIVSQVFSLPDPRMTGSQNPGATNVLRISGKKYAAMVLIADVLKGLLPVLFAQLLGAGPVAVSFTCWAAVMGHMYPVFFGFRGGKGVATAIGVLLGLHFMLGVVVIATWLLVANFSRYSSLASMVSISLAPWYALFIPNGLLLFPPLFFIMLFVIYQHRENITRLIDGKESKIEFKRSSLREEINAVLEEEQEELEQTETPVKLGSEENPTPTPVAQERPESEPTENPEKSS